MDYTSTLQEQIEEIRKINEEEKNRPLSLEELKQVFISIGHTNEDWQMLMQRAQEAHQRGIAHFERNNYQLAIESFLQSINLNPYNEDALSLLAKSHLELYIQNKNEKDEERTRYYVSKLSSLNPDDEDAIDILTSLRLTKESITRNSKAKRNDNLKIILFFVFFGGFAFLMFGGFNLFISDDSRVEFESKEELVIRSASDELAKSWTPIAFNINAFSRELNMLSPNDDWSSSAKNWYEKLLSSEPTVEMNSYHPYIVETTHLWFTDIFMFVSANPELLDEDQIKFFREQKARLDKAGQDYNKQLKIYNRTKQNTDDPGSYPNFPAYQFEASLVF